MTNNIERHFLKPNYADGSIVNVIASIAEACGVKPTTYAPCAGLSTQTLADADNIILLLVDGLGAEYLARYGQDSFLASGLQRRITSVFPTTTSAALTSIATASAPRQHALTGWFMFLREIAQLSAVLPFTARCGNIPLSQFGINMSDVIALDSVFPNLNRDTYVISHDSIVNSDYSELCSPGATRIGYQSLAQMTETVIKSTLANKDKKYLYTYWSDFDHTCHQYGVNSSQAANVFSQIDHAVAEMCEKLAGSKTELLVIADHGQLDTSAEHVIQLEDHPRLKSMLRLPLCGEPRAVFCYVRPECESDFLQYVATEMADYCEVVASAALVEDDYFGLGESAVELLPRLGDFVLLMKENYIMKDRLVGERAFKQIGVHGGLSEQELYVPLIHFSL